MRANSLSVAAAAAFLAFSGVSLAQDNAMQGHGGAGIELPEACRAGEAPSMPGMENMQSMMETMGEHQKAFMQGMMQTEGPMMQGMMAEDPDIAFACAMIPHHQGAINMAEVELEHGDSDEMKQMAQKVIDDQTREIGELKEWIEEQAQ
jgi:uncharacterized protein (DUF305 family)